ncbi:9329_t:CDS:2, partial [Funneliformis mosseae]
GEDYKNQLELWISGTNKIPSWISSTKKTIDFAVKLSQTSLRDFLKEGLDK